MAIGIDFGTNNSCCGVWTGDQVLTTDPVPTFVAFMNTGSVVGKDAVDQAPGNPLNTVYEFKCLLGRKFRDYAVQSAMGKWPFSVTSKRGKPVIHVDIGGVATKHTAVEISSIMLSKLYQDAVGALDCKRAVITVPYHFSRSQRRAVKKAGTGAGLHVLRVIDDPTAAAIAYGLGTRGSGKALVVDVGGSATLVSLVDLGKGKVVGSIGNHVLGGRDFDQCLVNYCRGEIHLRHGITTTGDALLRLVDACVRAKHELSVTTQAVVGTEFGVHVTRAQFEDLCGGMVHLILALIGSLLRSSKVNKSDVGEIVMAGGSSCIPMIQEHIRELFGGKALCNSIDPNVVVAYGATILAGRIV
ncbi:Heat shock 70 kDa protein 6 [Coemansia sp. IMI 209128]|nr:Heat shock 70 kDa protein 6 [Coemansia sp. IMI 209128]